MAIITNPAATRLVRDVKIYRKKLTNRSIKTEVAEHLPAGANPATFTSYRKVFFHQSTTNKKKPARLGGGLNGKRPKYLGSKLPKPVKGTFVTWKYPKTRETITIEVKPDGTIVHKDADGNETPAHHYLHAIFDDILYSMRDLLETINSALEKFADDNSAASKKAYKAAVKAFNDFKSSLQRNGNSPYATAFDQVKFLPVVTNEGYIVSCRLKLNWKNPYHSSSTIKVP